MTPGQGSQIAGMLSPWLVGDQNIKLTNLFSSVAGIDLGELGTKASQDEITETDIAQPLLTTLALISANALKLKKRKIVFAGHSVGEFSSCSLAGYFSATDAIRLVATRGKAMAMAATKNATGMSAILGGDKNTVINQILKYDLVPANVNSDGQIVASGLLTNLEKLSANPPKSTKIRKLNVAGAFHSEFMRSAEDELSKAFENVDLQEPTYQFISNKDGQLMKIKDDIKSALVSQITSPVRWDMCQATMKELGVTGMLELAPGGVLTGIAKREMPGVELFAIKSPEDIPAAQDFIDKHARIEG